jgi:hypothetical protein
MKGNDPMTDQPTIHVSVYGTTPPRAAGFGKGARDLPRLKKLPMRDARSVPGGNPGRYQRVNFTIVPERDEPGKYRAVNVAVIG